MSQDRWKRIWAYYAVLRKWLAADDRTSGYGSLLSLCDPDRQSEAHIVAWLGDRTLLKALYVERVCLFLEFAFHRKGFPKDSVQVRTHAAAASVLEDEIKANNPDDTLLKAITFTLYEGFVCYAGLELCHHKLFRRLDIIISSIGAECWREAMPRRGTDGFERAKLLESYLSPIEGWIKGVGEKAEGNSVAEGIMNNLGEQDDTKVFLTSLLVSLLRAQQIAARIRAKSQSKGAVS